MAAVTARVDNPRRAIRSIKVEQAPPPVATTVEDPVVYGINTAESRTEECDTELHRSDSNVNMVLTRGQSAERENEAQ